MFERLFAKRGLSLDRMRVLLEVREAGSIVKAAGSDPVRQSQYSRQLKELDEFFGAELTERRGRNLVLTAAGEELAVLIKEHFVDLGNFSRRLAGESLIAHIGAGESLIHWLALPVMPKLHQDVPGINIRFFNLTSSAIAERLLARDLDFGILRSDAVPPTASRHKIGRITYTLFVPKGMLAEAGGKRDQRLLAKLPLAVYPADSSLGRLLYQVADKAGIKLSPNLVCETSTGLASAVRTGHYAAILPDLAAGEMMDAATSIDLPQLKPLARDISLVWIERKVGLRPEIDRLGTWLKSNLPRQCRRV